MEEIINEKPNGWPDDIPFVGDSEKDNPLTKEVLPYKIEPSLDFPLPDISGLIREWEGGGENDS